MPTKLDPYKGMIETRLGRYPELSAVRLFDEIKAAGYPGGYTQLKEFVRAVRPAPEPDPVVRLRRRRASRRRWTSLGSASGDPGRRPQAADAPPREGSSPRARRRARPARGTASSTAAQRAGSTGVFRPPCAPVVCPPSSC
jgi:hypothetical protein